MFAFIVTVLLASPASPAAQLYHIQSDAVYLNKDDCVAGLDQFGKMFTAGLPKGTRLKVAGECVTAESVEG